ncbi:MAG: hypothetical protein K6F94_05730 [Bacteroidaceae bacterium]|nr:hypothetical protein [Bacteroidaceae bacterium]
MKQNFYNHNTVLKTLVLTIVMSLPFCGKISAEDLIVSSITGNVSIQEGTKRIALTKGQKLTDRNLLFLPKGSKIVVLAPSTNRQFTINGAFTGTALKYISDNKKSSIKSTTKKYMAYLIKQATEGEEEHLVVGKYEDSHATVVRSAPTLDSALIIQAGLDTIPDQHCCKHGGACAQDSIRHCHQ